MNIWKFEGAEIADERYVYVNAVVKTQMRQQMDGDVFADSGHDGLADGKLEQVAPGASRRIHEESVHPESCEICV